MPGMLLFSTASAIAQNWNIPTNNNSTFNTSFIGTINSGHFSIQSNGSNMIRFSDASITFAKLINAPLGISLLNGNLDIMTGMVGIGTTAGGSMLSIFNPGSKSRVYINDGATSFPSISFRNENANGGSWYHIHNTNNIGGVNALQITHGGKAGDNIVASFSNTGLGLGIANPNAKLDVQGGNIRQKTNELYDDAGNSHLRFNVSNGKTLQTGNSAFFRFNKNIDGCLEFYNTPNSNNIGTNVNTQRVYRITSDGRMSIGNAAPNSGTAHSDWKLSVDGAILSKKAVVTQLNWADDEFEKESPSLKAEQEYASKEKHLMGVPSEKELTETALDLGAMSAIQMRKIEQTFKHLWKQEEQINQLQDQLLQMQKDLTQALLQNKVLIEKLK